MAEIHGKTGGVYAASAIRRATTISFTGPTTISDSASGFVTAGFVQAMKIVVIGSNANNNTYTIATGGVAAGAITTTGTPNTAHEAAGNLVTIYQAPAGSAVAGFYNWSFDEKCDVAKTTDFQSAGKHEFLAGITSWTGRAERVWDSTDNIWACSDAVATFQWIRFFTKYAAIPSAPSPAIFFEGLAIVKTSSIMTPNSDAIKQTFEFQGVGTLTETTQTSAW